MRRAPPMLELAYPVHVQDHTDRYRYAYAVLKAAMEKHNERAGDLSPEANAHRKRCREQITRCGKDILALRPGIVTPDWKPSEDEELDPLRVHLKAEGYSAWQIVNLRESLGVDLNTELGGVSLPPDPTEDYTSYTKQDPNNRFTITSGKIAVVGLRKDEDAWVYDDKGSGHFGDTFEHDFEITIHSCERGSIVIPWAVSNVVEDAQYWDTNHSQAAGMYFSRTLFSPDLRLYNWELQSYDQYTISLDTKYYNTAERTDSTTLEGRIYDDAGRTNMLDDMFVSMPDGRHYQNVFACNSWNDGGASPVTADIENLDLKEVSFVELQGSVDAAGFLTATLIEEYTPVPIQHVLEHISPISHTIRVESPLAHSLKVHSPIQHEAKP